MANHRYTSLTDLLGAPQTREAFVSHGSGYNSDDHSFPIEMFGELCFGERSSLTSSSIWDLFNPPLPPPRRLPNLPPLHEGLNENPYSNQVQGLNEAADHGKTPDLENKNKTGKGKKKLSKNNCCKYDSSGKLFPPPISTLKMNRAGKPFVYREFDAGKTGFVPKMIFLPHEIMAASSSADGLLRMRCHHGFPAADEEEKEKSSIKEAEQKVSANWVKPGNKPQV